MCNIFYKAIKKESFNHFVYLLLNGSPLVKVFLFLGGGGGSKF